MELKTKRLRIRDLSPNDWKSMQKNAVDFLQSDYAVYDRPLPTEETEISALTRQFARTRLFYAVLLENVMIGYVCLHENNGSYDLGFCLHSDYQGKGYAFESYRAVMTYVAEERNGTSLKTRTATPFLLKAGFSACRRPRFCSMAG